MSFLSSYQNIKFSHVRNQFLAVICGNISDHKFAKRDQIYLSIILNSANLVCLAHGGSMGWLSPSLLVLQSADTPLEGGPIDNETASWVGAATYIGGVFGNVMFMAIMSYFGRKKTFCVLALPNLVS